MILGSFRRRVKNVLFNYSSAQIIVREATSNSQFGPSEEQMEEILNMMILVERPVFMDSMQILWERLNDSGKNINHIKKSLILMEFLLLNNGPNRIRELCMQNIHLFVALTTFHPTEINHDKGVLIREKAQAILNLLSNPVKKSSVVPNSIAQIAQSSNSSSKQVKQDETSKTTVAAKRRPLPPIPTSSATTSPALDDLTTSKKTVATKRRPLPPIPTYSAIDDLMTLDSSAWSIQSSLPTSSSANDNNYNDVRPVFSNLKLENKEFGLDSLVPVNTMDTDSFNEMLGGKALIPKNPRQQIIINRSKINPLLQKKAVKFLGKNKNLVDVDDLFEKTTGKDGASSSTVTNPFTAHQMPPPTLDELRAAKEKLRKHTNH